MRYFSTLYSNFIFWISKRTASEIVLINQISIYDAIPEMKKKTKEQKKRSIKSYIRIHNN